jgi:hypothetical protein
MQPNSQEIKCPRYPDHDATKRLLPAEEREQITRFPEEDVYEIDCPFCGKYEYREEFPRA